MDHRILKIVSIVRMLKEEMAAGVPTNNVGAGKIAGIPPADNVPPVYHKKDRRRKEHAPRIYLGKGSRKRWKP